MSAFGIKAIEIYFPKRFVDQKDLEEYDNCVGKYTIGLGQSKMSVTSSCEDVCSIALTVLHNLLERTKTSPKEIGFLEVGSETLIDKAKSTKTVLMKLFEESGNFDVAGTDSRNACFSGTAALFNAMFWLQSSFWDGRMAIAVASDIAVYGSKITRPTGGLGAVALLLGPQAPITFEDHHLAFTMKHTYDFYKPILSSEYPCVDGQKSMDCFKDALLTSYDRLRNKLPISDADRINMIAFDYACFHSPFVKLVMKGFYWITLASAQAFSKFRSVIDSRLIEINQDNALDLKQKEKKSIECLSERFSEAVEPSLTFARNCGNMYSAALYANLVSILMNLYENNDGKDKFKRVLMFSYGSGFASALFSLKIPTNRMVIEEIIGCPSKIISRLHDERVSISVKEFCECLDDREKNHNRASIKPTVDINFLYSGQYFLEEIDETYCRSYKRFQSETATDKQNGPS